MDQFFEHSAILRLVLILGALGAALWALAKAGHANPALTGRLTLNWAILLLIGQKLGGIAVAVVFSLMPPGSMAHADPIYQALWWIETGGIALAIVGLMQVANYMARSCLAQHER